MPSISAIPTGSFAPDSPSRIVPVRPRISRSPSTENITAGSVGATAAPSRPAVSQPSPKSAVREERRPARRSGERADDAERGDRDGGGAEAATADRACRRGRGSRSARPSRSARRSRSAARATGRVGGDTRRRRGTRRRGNGIRALSLRAERRRQRAGDEQRPASPKLVTSCTTRSTLQGGGVREEPERQNSLHFPHERHNWAETLGSCRMRRLSLILLAASPSFPAPSRRPTTAGDGVARAASRLRERDDLRAGRRLGPDGQGLADRDRSGRGRRITRS